MKFWINQTNSSNRSLRSDLRTRSAFTLVETLVVIVIIGVLVALGTQGANIAARKRDSTRVEAQLERLKLVIEDYKLRFGTYPPGSNLHDELRGMGVLNNLNKSGPQNPARQAKDFLPNLKPDETAVINGTTYLAVPALPIPPGKLVNNTLQVPSQLDTGSPSDYFVEVYVGPNPNDPYGPLPTRWLPFMGKFPIIALASPRPPNAAVGSIYQANGRQRLSDFMGQWDRDPAAPNVWSYRDPNSATNKHAGYDLWAEYSERGTGKPIIISNGK